MEKQKILIVNSDQNTAYTLAGWLDKEYEVVIARTIEEALAVFAQKSFNVVITEVDNPEIKGIEVLTKLKELDSETSVIVAATYGSMALAIEAMKKGADNYITKPFNLDELTLAVQHAIERQKLVQEAKQKKIYQEMALLDPLTQVYNRRYLEEILDREIDRSMRYEQKFSTLMIDVDDFKKCNDTYGHPFGDKVLRDLANILCLRSRNTDFVARYGGEEFIIIAPHTDKEGASVLAANLVNLIATSEFCTEDDAPVAITVSIGIATFREDAFDKQELLGLSDKALYQAKKLGKNRVCLLGGTRSKLVS
ncbi:MAG: diguanylate cyclase [Candidatus Omnitrophica bacterium]|nr:diguanylate cyclase [Candidatus Omnitrophota bacterium]